MSTTNKGNAIRKAQLIKANGEPVQAATAEAVETVSALNAEIGEELKNSLLLAINFVPSNEDTADATFSKAALQRIGRLYTDTKALIDALETKSKVWLNAGATKVAEFSDEFVNWATGLAPLETEDGKPLMLDGVNAEGIRTSLPARLAMTSSVTYLLYSLTELSNSALFGEKERVGRNGKKKPAKPSIFDNDKKGVQSTRLIGGNENWGFRATVNYLVNSGEAASKYCKAIELTATIASFLNQNNPIEAEKLYKILTGQVKEDKRFSFDPSLVKGLVLARFYGLLYSGIRQWIKELKEQLNNGQKQIAWANTESVELAAMMADIERTKAFNEAHPELNEKPEGLEVEAEEMSAVSESDVAFRRARGIFRRTIDAMVLDGTIPADTTISFLDEPLQSSIQQFADGLISEDEIKVRVGSYYLEYLSAQTKPSDTATA